MEVLEFNGEKYVLPVDLAKERGVVPEAVYMAIRRGTLESIVVIGRRLIPLAAANAWQPKTGRTVKEDKANDEPTGT